LLFVTALVRLPVALKVAVRGDDLSASNAV